MQFADFADGSGERKPMDLSPAHAGSVVWYGTLTTGSALLHPWLQICRPAGAGRPPTVLRSVARSRGLREAYGAHIPGRRPGGLCPGLNSIAPTGLKKIPLRPGHPDRVDVGRSLGPQTGGLWSGGRIYFFASFGFGRENEGRCWTSKFFSSSNSPSLSRSTLTSILYFLPGSRLVEPRS